MRILFVENHDSFSRNVMALLPVSPTVVTASEALGALETADALVIGPGPKDPARTGLIALIHRAAQLRLPTLGVCLGHQAIGMAFGATLLQTEPAHGQVAIARFSTSRRLAGISGPRRVMRYHSLSLVDVKTPLQVIASLDDGTVMALEHTSLPIVGLQFHPDSYASDDGGAYVDAFFASTALKSPPRSSRPPVQHLAPSHTTPAETSSPLALAPTPPFALLAPGYCSETADDAAPWLLLEGLYESDGRTPALWLAASEQAGASATRYAATRWRWVHPELKASRALKVSLGDQAALEHIETIRQAIARGDVYQVNYTLRAEVEATDGATLLGTLCARARPRFAAWISLGHQEHVCASPERLFSIEGTHIEAEPMKGTAAPDEVARLMASSKDAAELAMIVDLVRDDLQGICVPGSVRVDEARKLLELPYVLQTVGIVGGELRAEVTLRDALAALHPAGSVTGAPRPAAIEHLRALESTPRGLYCGAIGLELEGRATFAVAIRTASRVDQGTWTYGVGSGITFASDARAELDEIRLKLGALKQAW